MQEAPWHCVAGPAGLLGAGGVIWLRAGRYLLELRLSVTLALSRRERGLKRGGANRSRDDVHA